MSPKWGNVPLPHGLLMAYKQGLLTTSNYFPSKNGGLQGDESPNSRKRPISKGVLLLVVGKVQGGPEEPCYKWSYTLPETNIAPEIYSPGKGDSYWKPSFLGAMLVSGRVNGQKYMGFTGSISPKNVELVHPIKKRPAIGAHLVGLTNI